MIFYTMILDQRNEDTRSVNFYNGTILSFFLDQVKKNPNHPAVKTVGQVISYKELDEYSDRIAASLIKIRDLEDIPVGILLPRSVEFIVSLFGVLKAGGAYVPMNPNDGEERLLHIIRDSSCPILLTQSKYLKMDLVGTEVLEVKISNGDLLEFEKTPFVPPRIKPQNLAYIIYTSGTTGLPKGSLIEHRNLFWYVTNFFPKLNSADRTLQSMSPTFDGSVLEIFNTLCNGATLVLWEEDYSRVFDREKITFTCITPSMADLIDPKECMSLKYLYLAGEKLTESVVTKFPPHIIIYNCYGPTECTVSISNTLITDIKRIHIGGIINEASVYVVDPSQKICAANEIGELYIGGGGVGRGYWKRPDLTEEKFIKNPFGEGRVYRTGDLVKWNDLGDLEYIGRIDRQIKIRGYRVELDGIENIINRFPGVTGNHLRVEGQNLLSYVTPSNINLEKFKKYLEANLPQHAVPSQFFLLENFPINSTGKIDMKRLPMPDKLQKKDLPVGPGEIKMADLWQNILKIKDPISPKDNFFDLGGNSLSAIKLTHFLRKEISNSNLPIELIYLNPTLASYTASTLEFKLDLAKTDDNSFPILDLIKSLPSTLYFVVAWLIPTLGFLILLPKFPFLIFYYLFELVFFGLFGEKIKPIFQIIRNKINLDQLNFKEIKIVDSGLPNNLQGVIFCLHPHGLMDIHSLPLERHLFKKNISYRSTFERKLFWCPFLRTFLYLLGYIPATSENFKKKGINILTTPGDVAEFLQCGNPSTVFLSSNKIFFKLAIENGLTIVPIYAFDTEKSFKFYPSLNKWRDKVKVGVQTVAIVPFSGRFYLPIPFKTRTKVVIGEPLEIEKMENPSWKRIEETEKLYIEQLEKIYNTHRENNSPDLKIL